MIETDATLNAITPTINDNYDDNSQNGINIDDIDPTAQSNIHLMILCSLNYSVHSMQE